jgi:hypothetical protein
MDTSQMRAELPSRMSQFRTNAETAVLCKTKKPER